MAGNKRILCVDDEPNILAGYRRSLSKGYDIHTAVGPEEGMKALHAEGPFAVVVSDYAMPGMNGVEFLEQVKLITPDTVCIMLTGFANMDHTMQAVHEGKIFHFLMKPCDAEALAMSLDEGIDQYRRNRREEEDEG